MLTELSAVIESKEDEYLTEQEIKERIQCFTSADILRLGQIAKKYVPRSLMDADEILNETIVVTASGQRKVPRNVPFLAFLAATMKSIVSNEVRKISKKVRSKDDDPENDIILNLADLNVHIESEIAAKQEVDHIYELFIDDDEVTVLLMAKYDGLTREEICEMGNWDLTKYNSIQKRLRRGLNQHISNGRGT
jgi:DNA-directed RNA polymerase specialized sigma24 family protein